MRDFRHVADAPREGQHPLFLFPDLAIEELLKSGFIHLHQVRADGDGGIRLMEAHELLRVLAPVSQQPLHEPFRHAVTDGQRLDGFGFHVRIFDFVLLPHEVAQDAVAHARQPLHAQLLAQRDRRVARCAFRDAVFQQNLTRTQPQHVAQLDVRVGLRHQRIERVVKRQQVFQRVVHQPRRQTAVHQRQGALVQFFVQHEGGIRIVLRHRADDFERETARGQTVAALHLRGSRTRRIGTAFPIVATIGAFFGRVESRFPTEGRLFVPIWAFFPTEARFRRAFVAIIVLVPTEGALFAVIRGLIPTEGALFTIVRGLIATKGTLLAMIRRLVSTKGAFFAVIRRLIPTKRAFFPIKRRLAATEGALLAAERLLAAEIFAASAVSVHAIATRGTLLSAIVCAEIATALSILVTHFPYPLSTLFQRPLRDRADNPVHPSASRRALAAGGRVQHSSPPRQSALPCHPPQGLRRADRSYPPLRRAAASTFRREQRLCSRATGSGRESDAQYPPRPASSR